MVKMTSYLQAVYATMDRAPTKKGKKRRAMKMVCIWAALPDRRGGWQFWVRLTWGRGNKTHTHEQKQHKPHFSFITAVPHTILKFTNPWGRFSLNIISVSLHNRKPKNLIKALKSIASKVIQHVHETFSTTSSLGQITNHTELILWNWLTLPGTVQQKVHSINPKPCLSFPQHKIKHVVSVMKGFK